MRNVLRNESKKSDTIDNSMPCEELCRVNCVSTYLKVALELSLSVHVRLLSAKQGAKYPHC